MLILPLKTQADGMSIFGDATGVMDEARYSALFRGIPTGFGFLVTAIFAKYSGTVITLPASIFSGV